MKKINLMLTCATAWCALNAVAADVALPLSGKVAETMEGGRYTYMNVDSGKEKVWVACTHVDTKVGDAVQILEGRMMEDFKSPTLNRTFDQIIFASRVQVGTNAPSGGAGLPAGHPPVGGKMGGAPHGDLSHNAAAHGEQVTGEVIETMDVGAYTYVQYKTGTKTEWAAASKTRLAKGDKVVMDAGTIMKNFESPTLGRKFEEIRFVDSIRVAGGKPALPPGHP